MPISFNNVDKVYHGTTPIMKVYRGSVVEWDGHDYFYIENTYNGSNTLTLTTEINGSPSSSYYSNTVQYSKDKLTWTTLNLTTSSPKTISMSAGEKVYFRNNNGKWNYYISDDLFVRNYFNCSESHITGGNINSLLDYVNMDNLTLTISGCLFQTFYRNYTLTSAQNLKLPSTTLCNHCYTSLFFDNTSLTIAPNLPALQLASHCYYLTFKGCTSLTTAPVLPATTLAVNSYQQMFWLCSSLNSVTIYANDISATDCLTSWLFDVAATGTFYNLGSATYPSGVSGIPTGWTERHTLVNYFTIKNNYSGSNTISLTKNGSPSNISLQYSTNGGSTWTTWNSANGNLSVSLAQGKEILFKGDNNSFNSSIANYYRFGSTYSCKVSGNIMTLVDSTGNSTSLSANFTRLFYNNTNLDNDNLLLPATNISPNAYSSMFLGCTRLTKAPELPSTTLRGYCYAQMFYGCSSLTSAPVLPAAILSGHSYTQMFYGCSLLNNVVVYAEEWTTDNTENWLYGCASSGNLYNLGGATIPTGASGIPSGWTVHTSL